MRDKSRGRKARDNSGFSLLFFIVSHYVASWLRNLAGLVHKYSLVIKSFIWIKYMLNTYLIKHVLYILGVDWTLGTSHEQCAYEPAWLMRISLLACRFLFIQRKSQVAEKKKLCSQIILLMCLTEVCRLFAEELTNWPIFCEHLWLPIPHHHPFYLS